MKVLQVHCAYTQPGGEDAVVAAEADLLRAAGHEVTSHVVQNRSGAGGAGALALAPWNPMAARRVAALARDVRPDVAHVHNTWFSLSPSILRALTAAGIPVVLTLHNYRLVCLNGQLLREGAPCEDCVGRMPWPGVRHRCYRGSTAQSGVVAVTTAVHRVGGTWARHVSTFLVLSTFARDRLARGGVPPERIVVRPNWVPDPGPRVVAPSASHDVVFLGRVSPEKGLEPLLDTWRARPPVGLRLCVVGDGPDRARLEAGAPASVTFLGRRPPAEVYELLRSARALVLPSVWYEGQPLVVLEAMAAGLGVTATALGALPETIGDAGQLVPLGSGPRWEAALARLEDDAFVDTTGALARARYEDRFWPDAGLTSLLEAYEVAQRRRTGVARPG